MRRGNATLYQGTNIRSLQSRNHSLASRVPPTKPRTNSKGNLPRSTNLSLTTITLTHLNRHTTTFTPRGHFYKHATLKMRMVHYRATNHGANSRTHFTRRRSTIDRAPALRRPTSTKLRFFVSHGTFWRTILYLSYFLPRSTTILPFPLLPTSPNASATPNLQTRRSSRIRRARRVIRFSRRTKPRGTRHPRHHHGPTRMLSPSKSSRRRRRLRLQVRRHGNRRRQRQRTMNVNVTHRRTNHRYTRRTRRRVRIRTRITPLFFRYTPSRPNRMSTRGSTRQPTTQGQRRRGNSSPPSLPRRRNHTTRTRVGQSVLVSRRFRNVSRSLHARRSQSRIQSTSTTVLPLRFN